MWATKNPAISANVVGFFTGQVKLVNGGDGQKESSQSVCSVLSLLSRNKLPLGSDGCLATGLSLSAAR